MPYEKSYTPIPLEVVFLLEHVNDSIMGVSKIRTSTMRDPVLSRVYKHVQSGWPNIIEDSEFKQYMVKRDELSTEEGCILWGSRLVVPPSCQKPVLDLLHQCHPGITRMKSFVRSYVWWPNMDHALENITKQCDPCLVNQKNPSKVPLHPWMWPSRPWSRLHLDYAGHLWGKCSW